MGSSGRPGDPQARTEFDAFRDSYESDLNRTVAFTGQDADVYAAAKAKVLLELAERHVGRVGELSALDVGCGTGLSEVHLSGRFGETQGVDVSAGMIDCAKERNPAVEYQLYDGSQLPFPQKHFDVVFAICVLHHVPTLARDHFVAEMRRVTKLSGIVVVFEHNPLNPFTRFIVSRCRFDEDAVLIRSGTCRDVFRRSDLSIVATRNILFVPWRNNLVERFERSLGALPLGAQYFVAGRP